MCHPVDLPKDATTLRHEGKFGRIGRRLVGVRRPRGAARSGYALSTGWHMDSLLLG